MSSDGTHTREDTDEVEQLEVCEDIGLSQSGAVWRSGGVHTDSWAKRVDTARAVCQPPRKAGIGLRVLTVDATFGDSVFLLHAPDDTNLIVVCSPIVRHGHNKADSKSTNLACYDQHLAHVRQ